MRFDLLGPLDVVHNGRAVVLRGATQRAVLAYLLLHHNEVVATSSLLSALWPEGIPATARKMVQNAVSGLRTMFATRTGSDGAQPMLLTHAPGYLLRVERDQVDVARFRLLAADGRTACGAGEADRAVTAYREALGLWRGRMLADLAENGVDWPELAALEDERLAVHEDLFALELERGRHHEVLTTLRGLAEAHPHRERLNAQLMTALYRCGRHVDALEVFRATRASLAEGLGLEPGKELRELERAILRHDETVLAHGPAPVHVREPAAPPAPVPASVPVSPPVAARSVVPPLVTTPAGIVPPGIAPAGIVPPGIAPAGPPVIALAGPVEERCETERKPVVAVGIVPAESDFDPEDVAEAHARLRAVAEEEAKAEGAHLPGGPGPVLLAVFGVPATHDDDAVRAVRTALRIRDRLAAVGITTQIGVEAGDVLVEFADAAPVAVSGPALDRCVRSALTAPAGRVRVADAVREASEPAVVYGTADDCAGWWEAGQVRPHPLAEPADPGTFAGRGQDLDLLEQLLEFVERGGRPHRVTVVGEPGIGKTRLLAEFGELLAKRPEVRVLETAGDLAETFAAAPGLLPRTASRLRSGGAGDALRAAAAELTAHGPLVVLADDVHASVAKDALAGLGGSCAGHPVLVVAAARPELLDTTSDWTSARHAGTTLTLAPLADDAVADLLDVLLPDTTRLARGRRELVARIGGNPRFAHAYAAAVRGRTTPFPAPDQAATTPPLVRRTLAALLDSLPRTEKAVLKAATLTAEVFDAAEVAEVCDRTPAEIATALTALTERDVLRRTDDGYAFRRAALREVAYQRIPRAVRTELLRRPTGRPARPA
ncbi:BTAD domain-containing putative transcriptional regulator [Amycolatopsis jiangsuensis]|uniref:DNA-binding SARP family transcriptional activator n=1 Tax=Amycolatopsis jiangsuensis TaxID=1181879 RepID=A0A840IN55_9PSEU|nr:BTAD domain-containing putative transcriptional regulator [Amycolatopsis jiangsuensis]MBB4683786.1 DNA-binding SARP family transcriptional activator [Amycolatopsis jiangsuensis]